MWSDIIRALRRQTTAADTDTDTDTEIQIQIPNTEIQIAGRTDRPWLIDCRTRPHLLPKKSKIKAQNQTQTRLKICLHQSICNSNSTVIPASNQHLTAVSIRASQHTNTNPIRIPVPADIVQPPSHQSVNRVTASVSQSNRLASPLDFCFCWLEDIFGRRFSFSSHLDACCAASPIERFGSERNRNSEFSVLSSQYSVLSSQFSVLSTQYSVLNSQFSVTSSTFWIRIRIRIRNEKESCAN